MTEMFDAASRLAQGRPAADTLQDYVWACHLLGYQDPDLTLHASQLRDWYGSEDGIDLSALGADCETLRAAVATIEGAFARQDAQLALMSLAWQGPGAQASRDFLRRHSEVSSAAASAVRTAAESLTSLRDQLWHSVDAKVAATMVTQGRGARPEWQAAAQTVTSGAGDRATASELVDQEIKPFVANDIRSEWLTAIRSAIAAVTDAYDAAIAEVTSEVPVAFDVPGDVGPTWSAPLGDGVATEVADTRLAAAAPAPSGAPPPASDSPAGWSAWSGAPPAAPPLAAPPPPPLPAAPPVEPAAMAPPPLPSMGGGMPDVGSGLSGFGGQLGDMLGGLLGTSEDALSDLPESDGLDEPDELDKLDEDELDEDELEEDDDEPEEDVVEEDAEPAEAEPVADATVEPPADEPPVEPLPADVEPAPTPAPPPIEPLAAPMPPPAAGTPCEIAANELPQVGE
nr:hypothetical protein [Mycolicibacterium rhodesiae]